MNLIRHYVLALLFCASIFCAHGSLNFTALSPSSGAANVCIDTPLQITFNSALQISTNGSVHIYSADNRLLETIDLAAVSTRVIGGVTVTNHPVLVFENSAFIFPNKKFDYGQSYYVTIESNVFQSAISSFAGITNRAIWRFTTKSAAPKSGIAKLIVASDGTGDFCTIQGAIDFLPEGNDKPIVIHIRNGTYREIIHVNSKHNITFRGEDRKKTVITYPNNARLNGSNFRAMFNVIANDITLENLMLHNSTPRGGSQAEALRVKGEHCVLQSADLQSFQDTLQITGSTYVENCFVAGDVDFIWGSGSAYFTNCEIKTLKRDTSGPNGYILQSRNSNTNFGYVFVDCRLTAETGASNQILARIEADRFPDSHVAFINCAMGDHIKPEGWLVTTKTNSSAKYALRFWEYQSTDLTGTNLLDVSKRHSESRQLTREEAAQMRDAANVLGGWRKGDFNQSAAPPRRD